MSENAIVPFRTKPRPAVEPIDAALIPDCGAKEIATLQDEVAALERGAHALLRKRTEAIENRVLGIAFPAIAAVIFVCCLTEAISLLAACGYAVLGLFATFLMAAAASSCVTGCHPEDRVFFLELRKTKKVLEKRLHSMLTLERLTGKRAEADGLREEIGLFNQRIAEVDLDACTVNDLAMIAERRGELVKRIGDFRMKVLGPPDVPLQLAAGEVEMG